MDTLDGGSGVDVLDGGSGGTVLSDQIDGSVTLTNTGYLTAAGDRAISPDFLGNVTLIGGDGNQTIDINAFTTGRVTVFGGGGNDSILGSVGTDVIFGGDGNDTILGGGSQDFLFGEGGNDTVNGGGASDIISGGLGNDRIVAGSVVGENNILREDVDANLTLSTSVGGVHSLIGAGTDVLIGIFVAAILAGGPSNNRIDVTAFAGGTTLIGAAGDDTLLGGAFSDVVFAGPGADSIATGAGNDSLFGEDGDDLLQGGADNDLLRGGTGNDSFDGGAGTADRVSEQGNTNVVVNLLQLTSPLLGTDNALAVERFELTGGSGANLLDARLSSLPVLLNGGTGNDTLLGGGFIDEINGGSGNDIISGAAGLDTLNGGSGTDVVYEKANRNFTINGLQLTFLATGTETAISVEGFALVGGNGANTLDARLSRVPVTLLGGLGNDTLLGSNLADVLVGGSRTAAPASDGTDLLDGGAGVDTYDNGPGDTRVGTDDLVVANIFAQLPSWLDSI